ncbi:hypothetical protein LQW54_007284 [Pestalotiopsis sp. IQ-011]
MATTWPRLDKSPGPTFIQPSLELLRNVDSSKMQTSRGQTSLHSGKWLLPSSTSHHLYQYGLVDTAHTLQSTGRIWGGHLSTRQVISLKSPMRKSSSF